MPFPSKRERFDVLLTSFLENGADVNVATRAGETVLHEAAKIGDLDLTMKLLDSGADVNAATEVGETALHWAAGGGSEEVVDELLKRGALINAKTSTGETPLHWATIRNLDHIVQLLLKHGADPIVKEVDIADTAMDLGENEPDTTRWTILIGVNTVERGSNQGSRSFNDLAGCVNDVMLVEQSLKDVMRIDPSNIIKLMTGQAEECKTPTYNNILSALEYVSNNARPGDAVYIHYSGHGHQAPTAFPSLKGEYTFDCALVPTDTFTGGQYLRDLEIEYLVKEMVKGELLVTLVLDCSYLPIHKTYSRPHHNLKRADTSNHKPKFFTEIANQYAIQDAQSQHQRVATESTGYNLFTTASAGEDKLPDGTTHGKLSYHLASLLQHKSAAYLSCRTIYRHICARGRGGQKLSFARDELPVFIGNDNRQLFGANNTDMDTPLCD